MSHITNVVILAGGGGERLWPKSRKNKPKQCISLDKERSLIQQTYDNIKQFEDVNNILISTRQSLEKLIREQLPEVQLIVEPLGRDSAAGIGYACAYLLQANQDEVTVFMGADYYIPDLKRFNDVLTAAITFAEKNKIATIGIKPNRIETRFGYIAPKTQIFGTDIEAYEVKEFKEKPNRSQAEEYIQQGFMWNSGMFIVKPSVLYQNFEKYMPALHQALEKIRKTDFDPKVAYDVFEPLGKISIDYGVIEKTSDLVVVRGTFDWDDIGTWDSLDRIMEKDSNGNIINAEFLGVDVKDSIFFGEKPIIGLGLENIVVIDTDDCVFVCSKNKSPEIKTIIEKLEQHPNLSRLLKF